MIFYKCLKDKAMNIEINQYSYLSPKKNNNKQKGTILDANTRMVSLILGIRITKFINQTIIYLFFTCYEVTFVKTKLHSYSKNIQF